MYTRNVLKEDVVKDNHAFTIRNELHLTLKTNSNRTQPSQTIEEEERNSFTFDKTISEHYYVMEKFQLEQIET